MTDNLASVFGYPPRFLVVCIFQGFLMKLLIYKSTKYILGILIYIFKVFAKKKIWVKVAPQFS